MNRLSLVIFDWDGTLMNSAAKIVASMQLAALDCDVDPLGRVEIENIIGLSLPQAIYQLYPKQSMSVRELLAQRYSYHYLKCSEENPSPLFQGVAQLLEDLTQEGVRLAVATGKSRRGLNRVLRETCLEGYFATSRCADETQSKPNPDMVLEILQELKIVPEAALMIGDTEYDLEMASRANVASIGVTYGSHSRERLEKHKPIDCVDDSTHLWGCIKKNWLS